MREAFQTVAAFRSALSTRRDLLLEMIALRHQLGVVPRQYSDCRANHANAQTADRTKTSRLPTRRIQRDSDQWRRVARLGDQWFDTVVRRKRRIQRAPSDPQR